MEIGDKVYASFGKYGRIDVREGAVVKITPTGRINVDFGRRQHGTDKPILYQFKGGTEVGGDNWNPGRLIDRAAYDEMLALQLDRLLVEKLRSTGARLRAGNKAEILAWLEELRVLADGISDDYED